MDTIGTKESVLIRDVSLFQGLNYDVRTVFGERKVSFLERCPYFRGILREGFHCCCVTVCVCVCVL